MNVDARMKVGWWVLGVDYDKGTYLWEYVFGMVKFYEVFNGWLSMEFFESY